MVTYRRELEKKGWHRPFLLRFVLVALGLFVGLIGLLAWSSEQDKGGWEGSGLGHHMVGDDELSDRVFVWNEEGEVVFEGDSAEEAEAWIESQRNRNFTVPGLLIVGGTLLVIAGVAPSPRRPEPRHAEPRAKVSA